MKTYEEMDNKEKKKYLRSYKDCSRRISRIEAEIEEIRSMKINPSLRCDGMPHGNGISDLSEYASELDKLEREAYKKGVEQIKLYKEIQYNIKQLENETERDVLFWKYIKGLSWWEVASKMNYTERWVLDIHKKALEHLKIKKSS